jgi:hypothetical protein
VRQTAALLEYLRFVVEQEVHEVLREGHREALVCWEAILGEKRRARDNAG